MIGRLLIVGTGLMGGSVAAAARRHQQASEIWGVDPHHAHQAQDLGLIDRGFASLDAALAAFSSEPLQPGMQAAVVLAAPVSLLPAMLPVLAQHHAHIPWVWATEIGSSKQAVIAAVHAGAAAAEVHASAAATFFSIFVPSHPMAGAERSGPEAASPGLFQQARVLISPCAQSSPHAIDQVQKFWVSLGGVPSILPLKDHDALLASISHFPHLVAYCLAGLLASGPSAGAAQTLYGGGLRDTTRIAASSADLWADILLQNSRSILDLVPQWDAVMQEITRAIQAQDRPALLSLLNRAAVWRRGFH